MALRHRAGSGLRRAARGGAGVVALYTVAAVVATAPAVAHFGSQFLAAPDPSRAAVTPGDHLQTSWNLWLFGHQLEHGRAFWRDPYSFRPEASPRWDFQGLVFGLPFWPLAALFGLVVGWNLFVLASIAGAGVACFAWLRALDLPPPAALVGGLAFAIAPYRVAQSTGHMLGPIALFLPLALLGIELGNVWLATLATLAIPLSGQVHLALGAVPFVVLYALVRRRPLLAVPALASSALIAVAVERTTVRGSLHEQGRSLAEVGRYSAHWSDFVSRNGSGETFVFLGWLTLLLALAGLVFAARQRPWLAALLAAGAVVPVVLAVGTHEPLWRSARGWFSPLRQARVPERFLPIACLCLAALAAYAVARVPSNRLLQGVVLGLVAADLLVTTRPYAAARADEGSQAYAAIGGRGRLLELPVFLPDSQLASTYLYYDTQAAREHPSGYSTTAPRIADTTMRRLRPLGCGTWPGVLVERLGIRWVAVHRSLYDADSCRLAAERTLRTHGFRAVAAGGEVALYIR
jgi:hypothetical protein